jgi:hypothetical protein
MILQQPTAADVAAEMARLQRNFTGLNGGLWVAWLVLLIYVLLMARREKELKRELASLRAMLEEKMGR